MIETRNEIEVIIKTRELLFLILELNQKLCYHLITDRINEIKILKLYNYYCI